MILLDTHVLVWLAGRPERLSGPATKAIRRAADKGMAIASASLMELAGLAARRKEAPLGDTPQAWMRDVVEGANVAVRDITIDIAAVAAHLPPTFPADPFDRLIAATAIVERRALVTADERIRRSGVVRTIW